MSLRSASNSVSFDRFSLPNTIRIRHFVQTPSPSHELATGIPLDSNILIKLLPSGTSMGARDFANDILAMAQTISNPVSLW